MNELDPVFVIACAAIVVVLLLAVVIVPRAPKRCSTCAAPPDVTCEFCERRSW